MYCAVFNKKIKHAECLRYFGTIPGGVVVKLDFRNLFLNNMCSLISQFCGSIRKPASYLGSSESTPKNIHFIRVQYTQHIPIYTYIHTYKRAVYIRTEFPSGHHLIYLFGINKTIFPRIWVFKIKSFCKY